MRCADPRERWLSFLKGMVLAEVLLGVWLLDTPGAGAIFHAVILVGVAAGVAVGIVRAREGSLIGGRVVDRAAFLLFALLEHRAAVYGGAVVAAIAAATWAAAGSFGWVSGVAAATVTGAVGIGIGAGVYGARRLSQPRLRAAVPLATLGMVALLAWALRAGGVLPEPVPDRTVVALNLLMVLPLLCVLLFIARSEDTGLEIAALCVTLAVALWQADLSPMFQRLTLLVPALAWFVLTTRIEKPLRWLKAVLEAEGLAQRGDRRGALAAFREAASLQPADGLSGEGIWRMVRHLDEEELATDDALGALLPVEALLARARALRTASPSDPVEAHRLLRVVARRSPGDAPPVWLELAAFHAQRGEWDDVTVSLRKILDSDGPCAPTVSAEAWCLALATPELADRLVRPLLDAGRRMEAILAVERGAERTGSAEGLEAVKRALYDGLREDEYRQAKAAAREAVADHFDHARCRRIGREWAAAAGRFERAVEMLRIARDRVDPCATTNEIAALYEARHDMPAAMAFYEETKMLASRQGDPDRLPKRDEAAFVEAVTRLAEWHEAAGRIDDAIAHRRLLNTPARRSLPSQLHLLRLQERCGRIVAAINEVEQALMYAPKQRELLEIKRRLYAKVAVADVRDHLDSIRPVFDFAWCLREGTAIVGDKNATREELAFARHLLWLADLSDDDSRRVTRSLLLGRVHRRLGENDVAIRHLEAARDARGDAKLAREEDDAYYAACRLLAELYIERHAYEGARDCLLRFRPHMNSGADTYMKLGEVEEALGRPEAARKHYEALIQVYPKHPLARRAHASAVRLGSDLPAPKAAAKKPRREDASKKAR